jgi:hypothetical protein
VDFAAVTEVAAANARLRAEPQPARGHPPPMGDRKKKANSYEELRKIIFDADAVEVELAIRDVLHPASGLKLITSSACARAVSSGCSRRALAN